MMRPGVAAVSGWVLALAAVVGCSGSSAGSIQGPWCCELSTDGTWNRSTTCGPACPADVIYQEACTYDADGPGVHGVAVLRGRRGRRRREPGRPHRRRRRGSTRSSVDDIRDALSPLSTVDAT